MKDIKKLVIDGDDVYMKKSFDGWRVVYPVKNEDGSYNWKNIIFCGNVYRFAKIMMIPLLLILAIIIYHHDTQTCTETLKHLDTICLYFKANATTADLRNVTINLTDKLNIPLINP